MPDLVNTPPFLFTYWNPFSKDSSLVENWFEYVKDVSLANYTANSVGRYLQQVSSDQIEAIHSTGRKICGAFYEGLSNLESQIGRVQGQRHQVSGQLRHPCRNRRGRQRLG
jgi:CRISPR/Cas system-associated protein Csm6